MGETPLRPPPPVVGYGRRPQGVHASVPRAPASILHAQPSVQPLPRVRLQGTQVAPAENRRTKRSPFARNIIITIAQVLAVVQGLLGLVNGVSGVSQAINPNGALGKIPLPTLVVRSVPDMVGVVALSLGVIACAAVATRPANTARWLLVAWEAVALLLTLVVFAQFPLLFGAPDAAIVAVLSTGVGLLNPLVVVALAGVIIFGFGIYAPTRKAYARPARARRWIIN